MAVRRTSGTGDQQARRTSGSSGQGARRISGAGDGVCLYVGNGSATLTIYGYRHWMEFLKCNEMPLSDEDIDALESAASCRNYSIEGTIKVNWPVVTVEFEMEKFLGERKGVWPQQAQKLSSISVHKRAMCRLYWDLRTVTV